MPSEGIEMENNQDIASIKAIMSEVIESLFEYAKGTSGESPNIMAYDVLLTAVEQAEALDVDLSDIGLTKEAVSRLAGLQQTAA